MVPCAPAGPGSPGVPGAPCLPRIPRVCFFRIALVSSRSRSSACSTTAAALSEMKSRRRFTFACMSLAAPACLRRTRFNRDAMAFVACASSHTALGTTGASTPAGGSTRLCVKRMATSGFDCVTLSYAGCGSSTEPETRYGSS